MVKKLFFYLALCVAGYSANEELFSPYGIFYFTNYDGSGYVPSSFHFEKAYVYQAGDKLCATVEKQTKDSLSYTLKIDDQVIATHLNKSGIFDSLKEFEVQDSEKKVIGKIKSTFFTLGSAEFYFYDERSDLFAIGRLDPSQWEFTFRKPDGKVFIVCSKTYEPKSYWSSYYIKAPLYHWKIDYLEDEKMDPRFLWPFFSFISDRWWEGY